MPSDENIVLDPDEFIQDRTELDLNALGLEVRDAEWGDAEHELFLIRQQLGEIPADRHPPNRTVTITLKVMEQGAVSLADAAYKLQQKVGLLQREGGWVRRDPDSRGEFAKSVGAIVHNAVLGGLHGWLMAHRQLAPDVTLTLTISPYFYSPEEFESETYETTTAREVEWELAAVKGTAPGLLRVRATNNGTADWNAMIAAIESRDYPGEEAAASTAKLAYEAEDLTFLGSGMTEQDRTNDSGKVVRYSKVNEIWTNVLGSEIDGVGHMTHFGTRRVFVRVYAPELGPMLRLEYRSLGTAFWEVNDAVVIPLEDDFALLDLGEVRLERAVLGEDRWEFRIGVKTETDMESAEPTVDFDKVWILPVEQLLTVSLPEISPPAPSDFKAQDEFNQSAGNLNGKALQSGGGNWATSGSADGDFKTDGAGLLYRDSDEDLSARLAKPPIVATGLSAFAASVDVRWGEDPDDLNFTAVITDALVFGGTMVAAFGDGGGKVPVVTGAWYTLTALVSITGDWAMGWFNPRGEPLGEPFRFTRSEFLVTETFEISDRIFISGEGDMKRYFDNFAMWVPELEPVCHAGRSVELRSDGVYREHLTDDVWGRLAPEGQLPVAAPSGLEERTMRGIVIPSQGNMDELGDANTNKIEVVASYRPAYHFLSEAA